MDWKDFITWLLVIAGWFFIHMATLRREERKESHDTARKIVDEIRIVEEKAVEFQTSINFSDENYDMLVWKLNRITTALYRPPLKFLNISTNKIISFRQQLTANTDKSSFKTQSHNDEVIINIHEAADDLISEIEVHKYIFF